MTTQPPLNPFITEHHVIEEHLRLPTLFCPLLYTRKYFEPLFRLDPFPNVPLFEAGSILIFAGHASIFVKAHVGVSITWQ
jgi:hypothetical protein